MYTKRDDAIRGLIPVAVIGVTIGLFALGMALGVNPDVQGLTMVALLVGLVVWRIYVARHPEGWPLPKKVFHALRAVGFRGAKDQGGQGDDFFALDDGFSVTFTENASIDASMNEKTRELSFTYRRRGASWLRREEAFDLVIERNETDGDLRSEAKTPAEKRFAAWIRGALGDQVRSLPVTSIDASKKAGNEDPRLFLRLTVPAGTFAEVSQVVAAAKELFWKLVGAVDAERTETWLA